jgi:hypothetical protein
VRPATPVPTDLLRRRCDPASIPFETTADVEALGEIVGQDRAVDAVRFGVGIKREGYNLFALGPHGTGKQTLLRQYLDARAAAEATPGDACYVHNFTEPHRPRALRLPAGTAARLRKDMEGLVAELRVAMPSTFEGEEYRTRRHELARAFKDRREKAFTEAQERAKQRNVAVVETDTGVLLAPLRDGQPLEADRFHELPEDERERLQAAMEQTREELSGVFREAHEAEREHREAQRALDREFAATVARQHVDEVRARYREMSQVVQYLGDVENDIVENADDFLQAAEEGIEAALLRAFRRGQTNRPSFIRYSVNVLVDNGEQRGAPVVYVDFGFLS